MTKKNLIKLIYRSLIVIIGILGVFVLADTSSGFFDSNRFVFFTNQSNLLCIGFCLFLIIRSLIKMHKNEDDVYGNVIYIIKLSITVAITITMLVYCFILAPTLTFSMGFSNISNFLIHVIVPLMMIADYFIFDEHGRSKWWSGFYSMIYPIVYFIYAMIRGYSGGIISMGELGTTRFPYFFIDPDKIGWFGGGSTNASIGVVGWVTFLIVGVFILTLFYHAIDQLLYRLKKK